MADIEKLDTKEEFLLANNNSQMNDMLELKPLREKAPVMTLSDAIRAYRIKKEDFEFYQKDMERLQPEKTGVLGTIGAGIKEFKQNLEMIPDQITAQYITAFDGQNYPNMTREQALGYAKALINLNKSKREGMKWKAAEEGRNEGLRAVGSTVSSGLSQIFAIAGLSALSGPAAPLTLIATTGAMESGDAFQDWSEKYMEKHEGSLEGFIGDEEGKKSSQLAAGHGVVSGSIAKFLGVEKLLNLALKGTIKKGIGKTLIKSAGGEFIEEGLQEGSKYGFGLKAGYDDRTFSEASKDAVVQALYGGFLGGIAGTAFYGIQKKRLTNNLMNDGLTQDQAVDVANEVLDGGTEKVVNELIVRDQLTNAYGDEYNNLVDKIESVLKNANAEGLPQGEELRRYANNAATDIGMQAIRIAKLKNIPVKDVLDISEIKAVDNILYLETPDVNDPKALSDTVKHKKEELKKLGKQIGKDNKTTKKELNQQIKILNARIEDLGFDEKVTTQRNNATKAKMDQSIIASTKPEIIQDLAGIRQANVNEDFIYVGNSRVPVNYTVMPLSEVQGSHVKGEPNPKYTFKELQNRTRGTVVDEAILQNRAANFKAEEVLNSPNTQYGAPVINHKSEVISGNGRLEVIRKAYEMGKADGYIKLLNKMGYDTKGIENPVLVRQTSDNLSPSQQLAIAEASNVSETSAFDHARQALNDSKLLTKGVNNAKDFGDKLPITERQGYITENNKYDSLSLQRRFDDAVLAWILGDTKTFESVVMSNRLSPKVMTGLSQKGGVIVDFVNNYPEVGLKEDLRQAMLKAAVMRTKADYVDTIQQIDIEQGDTFSSDALLYAMTFSNNSSQLGQFIDAYTSRHGGYIEDSKNNFLADALPQFSKNDLTGQVIRDSQITAGKWNSDNTTNDVNLRALFLNQIPIEFEGEGTTNINTFFQIGNNEIVGEIDTSGFKDEKFIFDKGFNKRKDFKEFAKKLANKLVESGNFANSYVEQSERSEATYIYLYKVNEDRSQRVKIRLATHMPRYGNSISNFYYNTNKTIKENMIDLNNLIKGREYGKLTTGKEQASMLREAYGDNDYYGMLYLMDDTPDVYYQNVNGFFDKELKAVVIGSNANTGTLPHEMAHFWLDKLFNTWKKGNANPEFMQDFNRLAEILNINPEQDFLTRNQQEQFASMTEGYIFNRAAFPEGSEPIMKLYMDWLPPQYNSMADIGFRQADGTIYNPIFDQKSKEYFDNLYSAVAGLGRSPMSVYFDNPEDKNGEKLKATQEQIKERNAIIEKEATERLKEELTNQTQDVIDASFELQAKENPTVEAAYSDAIEAEKARPKTVTERFKNYVTPGRGTNTRAEQDARAQEFISKNTDSANEIAFGNPINSEADYVENTSGVDRAVLIINVMKNYDMKSPEYAALYHNLALTRSLAGKTGGLTNDLSQRFYLKAYGQIVNSMEQRAAVVKYGKTKRAVEYWNRDIDRFIQSQMDSVLKTAPESAERDAAINRMLQNARQAFGEDTQIQLLQEDLNRVRRAKKGEKKVFEDWARKEIKKMAKGAPTADEISQLMTLSVEAQKAATEIDSNDKAKAIAASLAIRRWQDFVSSKGIPQSFMQKIIGQYAPRAMLSGISTHAVNIAGNTASTAASKIAMRKHYGKNIIPKNVIKDEVKREWGIYWRTGINIAQNLNIDDVSKIHGEQYTLSAEPKSWKHADPFRILGYEDFYFRINSYLDALARMASRDAKGDVSKAIELFNEYKKLNSTNDAARDARIEALTVGNIVVFQQDGTLAKVVSQLRDALDLINFEAPGQRGYKGLGTLIAPFAKTPANIVGLGLDAIAAPFKRLGYYAGLKKNWTINDSIALTNSGLALALVTAMIVGACEYEPPYNPPAPYDPKKPYDSIKLGGVWLGLDTFGVLATPIRIALMLNGGDYNGKKGVSGVVGETIGEVIGDIPLVGDVTDEIKYITRNPADYLAGATYNQVNKLFPAIARTPTKILMRQTGITIDGKNRIARKFARAYGLDGSETSINDYVRFLYNRATIDE